MNNVFGTNLAAARLDKLLKEKLDAHQRRKLMRLFHQTNSKFELLLNIPSLEFRKEMINLLKKEKFEIIDSKSWDESVKTYLKNVITAHSRKYVK